jgi:hypothetical protein
MKVYGKESQLCSIVATTESNAPCGRTFREKTWEIIASIASLDGVVIDENWAKRRKGAGPKDKSISVDGFDVRTPEEFPFNPSNYSFKFNGPGARFELVLSYDGSIARLSGPYRPGFNPDDRIFRKGTMRELDQGETAEGDGLYRRKIPNVFTGDATKNDRRIANLRRARHENMNARLKRYGCLDKKFEHSHEKLNWCVRAVAVTTQLEVDNGMTLFDPY